jgi:hypothetical protein
MKKLMMLGIALSLMGAGCGDSDDVADTQQVSINFDAVVATDPFVCGNTYDDLGANGSSLQVSDFRFFVQSLELKNDAGDYVPVTLADNEWQAEGAALLDFEDGCNDLGTAPTNTSVTGTVPAGTYAGIRFQMGVPFEANHDNPATAPSGRIQVPPHRLRQFQYVRLAHASREHRLRR